MNTSFSYQLRVAACDRCGAPLEVNVAGGSFECRYCHAQNQIALRDEGLLAPPRQPVPEHERVARLRMQDGRPLLPPPSITHLMPAGRLEEWKVEEAIAVWNSARQELRAQPGSYDAAERIVFLSMVLVQHFSEGKEDKLRQRALLEGALDVVKLPRHRQIVRGFLARAAVRENDIQAAEAWLAPCDPASDDLQSDSAYRFTRAFIDTATGNFQRVLQVLGQNAQEVPIEDASDDVCAVFRANAWEKMGRADLAVHLLRERMGAGGGSGRQTIERVVHRYAQWHLCAMSYPQAAAGYAHIASEKAAQHVSGGIHKVFFPLGVLMAVVGALCLAAVPLGFLALDMGIEGFMGFGITGGTFLFMGLIFGGIGYAMKKSAEKAAWLRMHGVAGTGVVRDVSPTGVSINHVPQLRYTLEIRIPTRAPYNASTTALGRRADIGASIAVRVHPQNPNDFIMELD
ncbi:MAG: hypothetical protein KIT84_09750 [Labilithrix sp.]|nr:hypothetical protein [Labilithrix sp.]MCW5811285.1 hypothetical protein [Labilithrix sp.]